ncbi:MAG: transcription-repair coupling factor [Deltaproteobacteria bacterium]|nr:transcription-repair coupling factor [Deltaproteobacteria bacterium]
MDTPFPDTRSLDGCSVAELTEQVSQGTGPIYLHGLTISSQPFIISHLFKKLQRSFLIVAPTPRETQNLFNDLTFFLGSEVAARSVFQFPGYEILPYQETSPPGTVTAKRMRTLCHTLSANGPGIYISYPAALMQKLMPRHSFSEAMDYLVVGQETDRARLIDNLTRTGYLNTSLVEEWGDFSVRGDLLDVFGPTTEYPVRIEFFGDLVESIREFSPSDQRSLRDLSELLIAPSGEVLLKKANIALAIQRAEMMTKDVGLAVATHFRTLENIRSGNYFPGIESYLPLFYPQVETLFDYLPPDILVINSDSAEIRTQAEELEWKLGQQYARESDKGRLCLSPAELYLSAAELAQLVSRYGQVNIKALQVQGEEQDNGVSLTMHTETTALLKIQSGDHSRKDGLLAPFISMIWDWIKAEVKVCLVTSTLHQAEKIFQLMEPYGVPVRVEASVKEIGECGYPGNITIYPGDLTEGFVFLKENLIILTEEEALGTRRTPKRARKAKERLKSYLESLSDLQIGDFVVHVKHGIGLYQGLTMLTVGDLTNEFMLLEYFGGDKLYIPVDRLEHVQKYMGIEGRIPQVDRLGGRAWEKAKGKIKQSIETMAKELLNIYSMRAVRKGYAFSHPDAVFHEFEAAFEYDETPDQVTAINDVIDDMLQDRPMDRLVCGDVGFGKTEVALRAAFKSAMDGKQVAMLVPTTVLAEQHYQTFSRRMEPYPVTVEVISRFKSRQAQKVVLTKLAEGKIDIIIGTHRLLQDDVVFRDLGLIIIDEEQRFGVAHKERLKKFRLMVDVLTLTATPIPRTLNMSLMSIRDISTIETPPEDRLSIKTYITKFEDITIIEAILREIKRGGQVFFVHNRVQSIAGIANHLRQLLPQLKFGVAHGQMKERELEKVMMAFLNREIDVLVTTAIIESGLDIPSANTIIINQADRFGLAQIYQLRGRVGRSKDQAYAYLLIPGESNITRDAQKRLRVLMDFTELGSGFKIALHDLQIRGAGNVLGASQSGHISEVGYEMYLELIEQTIRELKGEDLAEEIEPEIKIGISAYLPESYVPDVNQRLNLYKRLSSIRSEEELVDVKEEISDRFGEPPVEVKNLIDLITLRILMRQHKVHQAKLDTAAMVFAFDDQTALNIDKIIKLSQAYPQTYQLEPNNIFKIFKSVEDGVSVLQAAKKSLQELLLDVNVS